MRNYRFFSGLGGAIALVCILFLPVVGCGNDTATCIDVLHTNNINVSIKMFLLFAILAGAAGIFLRHTLAAIATSIFGFVSLILSYFIAHNKVEIIEMKAGAYLAMLGFVVTAVTNWLKLDNKRE